MTLEWPDGFFVKNTNSVVFPAKMTLCRVGNIVIFIGLPAAPSVTDHRVCSCRIEWIPWPIFTWNTLIHSNTKATLRYNSSLKLLKHNHSEIEQEGSEWDRLLKATQANTHQRQWKDFRHVRLLLLPPTLHCLASLAGLFKKRLNNGAYSKHEYQLNVTFIL